MWFNNKYGRYDHLFQDRFKSEIIETENYLLQCFHYILQDIYTINKTPKTYIPTHMLYGLNHGFPRIRSVTVV